MGRQMKAALCLVLIAGLAGCGGDDGESPGSPRRDDFTVQLDGLCKTTNPKLAAINRELVRARDAARAGLATPRETFATFERLLVEAQAVTDRLLVRLRRLEPPAAEEEFHDALEDSLEDGAANVRRQANAARAGDAAALRRLSVEGSRLNGQTKALVQSHGGFRHCGRG